MPQARFGFWPCVLLLVMLWKNKFPGDILLISKRVLTKPLSCDCLVDTYQIFRRGLKLFPSFICFLGCLAHIQALHSHIGTIFVNYAVERQTFIQIHRKWIQKLDKCYYGTWPVNLGILLEDCKQGESLFLSTFSAMSNRPDLLFTRITIITN